MRSDELDKQALKADSLRQEGMTRAEIAAEMGISESQVGRRIARARRYYRDRIENFDGDFFLGQSYMTLLRMEREAMNSLKSLDANNSVAVEWLQLALDIRKQIVELMKDYVIGRTKSEKSEAPAGAKKSRRDKARTKLRKLRKERDLHCIRPESPDADAPESK